jgi:DNA-binding NtrC family response regulator
MTIKVLLVDDEQEFTRVLAERLEARGITVVTAESGRAALAEVEKERFDVLVLDYSMPEMDGIETLRRLKAGQPELQVIFLTGYATVQRGVEALKLGAMDFLEKPTDIQGLTKKIREANEIRKQFDAQQTAEHIEQIMRSKAW